MSAPTEQDVRRVVRRAEELFAERAALLPTDWFEFHGTLESKHDSTILIVIDSEPKAQWLCDEVLKDIVTLLNQQFGGDRRIGRIELDVPGGWIDPSNEKLDIFESNDKVRVRWNDNG